MKVLSVCTSYNEGGAARAAYRIHQGIRALGIDGRMLVKNSSSEDPSILSLSGFIPTSTFYKAFDWVRNKGKNQIQHFQWGQYPNKEKVYMSDLRGTDIRDVFHRLDYDILHLHWINQRFISIKDLPKNKPIVWTLHDSWAFCGVCHYFLECERYKKHCGECPFLHSGKDNDLSYQLWKKKEVIYRGLNLHIVTPSHWLGMCARESSLLGRYPLTVIPNGLDVNAFRPMADEEISVRWRFLKDRRKGKRYVLFGAMNAVTDRIKGFSHLVSALNILEEREQGNDFELIVFGAEQVDLQIDCKTPIHYVGYVKDVEELVSLYNLADVMVVPSLTEVFGQTASEALSCGTPVVAFNCTGIKDVIEHKKCGYLAKPYDDEDLTRGILWCLNNNLENRLGVTGRERVLSFFSIERTAAMYAQLYESLT